MSRFEINARIYVNLEKSIPLVRVRRAEYDEADALVAVSYLRQDGTWWEKWRGAPVVRHIPEDCYHPASTEAKDKGSRDG